LLKKCQAFFPLNLPTIAQRIKIKTLITATVAPIGLFKNIEAIIPVATHKTDIIEEQTTVEK
jgi:hypothetical protein